MAGYEWSWTFFLNKTIDGRFTVSAKQTVNEDGAARIRARRGLRDGIDVYEALFAIVDEAGYHLNHDLEAISRKIGEVDQSLVTDFLNGEELSEQREMKLREREATRRESILRPYRQAIDEYAMQISDTPLRYPGGGNFPSRRVWIRAFIEQHVLDHGELPDGKHNVNVRAGGYMGGEHDFTGLTKMAHVREQTREKR